MNINTYLNDSIQRIAGTVLKAASKSLKEMRFVSSMIPVLRKNEKQRENMENKGTHIPPFLIASITSACNLHCAGCYARASGSCSDSTIAEELTGKDWKTIFAQASELGISFILLAGGEPLMRRDVIEEAALQPGIVFPVFTNGLLIDAEYLHLFDENRHLIPVLSIEGDSAITDARRGKGVATKVDSIMESLKQKEMLFGVSITVTSKNMSLVTSDGFVSGLRKKGAGIIFFVEYVPVEAGSELLVLSEMERQEQEENIQALKAAFKNMIVIAFPGDEKYMGGCLAAGRGFFHLNAAGGAEPCPFSPFSDMNVKETSLLEVISSPFFRMLKESELMNMPHSGGCALFDKEDAVREKKLKQRL